MATRLEGIEHELGGLTVKRILPNRAKKMVGPFIFFDHMGPSSFAAGEGVNVRPHPHIGLSTLTYLFEGAILHRDSLGNNLEIEPGDVNWMTAGRGIVHSERESFETRANAHALNGLQCWVALPPRYVELEPSFSHVKKSALPVYTFEDVMIRLIVGEAWGMQSPVKTYSPMFYADIVGKAGSEVSVPDPAQETALYPISGTVQVGEEVYCPGEFVVLSEDETSVRFQECGRVIMLGGDKCEQPPHIFWNFVAYDRDRIERAKADWKAGKFPSIPGDDYEFIPLPQR